LSSRNTSGSSWGFSILQKKEQGPINFRPQNLADLVSRYSIFLDDYSPKRLAFVIMDVFSINITRKQIRQSVVELSANKFVSALNRIKYNLRRPVDILKQCHKNF